MVIFCAICILTSAGCGANGQSSSERRVEYTYPDPDAEYELFGMKEDPETGVLYGKLAYQPNENVTGILMFSDKKITACLPFSGRFVIFAAWGEGIYQLFVGEKEPILLYECLFPISMYFRGDADIIYFQNTFTQMTYRLHYASGIADPFCIVGWDGFFWPYSNFVILWTEPDLSADNEGRSGSFFPHAYDSRVGGEVPWSEDAFYP